MLKISNVLKLKTPLKKRTLSALRSVISCVSAINLISIMVETEIKKIAVVGQSERGFQYFKRTYLIKPARSNAGFFVSILKGGELN